MVAQLVRAPACHAGGREFESRPFRQTHKELLYNKDMDVEEKIREYSEELKNLFHYEPYNEVAIAYITNELDKLRKKLKDGGS